MPDAAFNLYDGDQNPDLMEDMVAQQENASLKKLLTKVTDLAVLPHVVFRVLELSGSSDHSTTEFERVITVDPGFSSKVLILANSAAFALPKKVTSIREALMFLGFKSIRQMAMTVGVFDLFVGKNDRESLRRRAWWRHSVDTAVCARWLADGLKKLPGDDAYTCGLLHLIGKTLLDRLGETDYKNVEDMVMFGIKDFKAEEAIYGCNHMDVAAAAAAKWGLSETLISGLHYAQACEEDDPFRYHRACTAIATKIATLAVEGASGPMEEVAHCLPAWAMEIMGITPERAGQIIDGGTAAIATWNMQI